MAVATKLKETRTFIEESWVELQKVTWPDQDQLRNATIVVIVFTVAVSIIIWLMDAVVRNLIELIMGMFGA